MSPDPWTTDDFLREIGNQLERIADALTPPVSVEPAAPTAGPRIVHWDRDAQDWAPGVDRVRPATAPASGVAPEQWITETAEALDESKWMSHEHWFDACLRVLRGRLSLLAVPDAPTPIGYVRVQKNGRLYDLGVRRSAEGLPCFEPGQRLCAVVPVADWMPESET